MSESTGAPASAPASTPSPAVSSPSSAPDASPAPASLPAISASDAARLLRARRNSDGQQGQGESRANPVTQGQGENRANVPAKAPGGPAQGDAAADGAKGLSAMERALGLPAGAGAGDPAAAPVADDGVEVDGARYTRAQLKDAIDRARDYTQKTQQVAEQMRQLKAQQESLATVLPYIQPELAKLQAAVDGAPRPDPSLLETDPGRYLRELAAHERAREEQQRLGNLTQLQQQAQARAMEQQVAQANEVLAREFPFWADPAERRVAQSQIVDWATTQGGFSHDELKGLTDPRALKMMMKARQYDELVRGSRTTAPMPTLAAAPVRGQAPPPAPSARITAANEAFEANPSIRLGAALLGARRGNGTMGNTR